jgi:hypothetical protein
VIARNDSVKRFNAFVLFSQKEIEGAHNEGIHQTAHQTPGMESSYSPLQENAHCASSGAFRR